MTRTVRVTVTLNGSPDNPWHLYGLTCNPFPQLARAEHAAANKLLRALDSDPLASTDDIRRILAGCDPEFIDLCCRHFRQGQRTSFMISWPE